MKLRWPDPHVLVISLLVSLLLLAVFIFGYYVRFGLMLDDALMHPSDCRVLSDDEISYIPAPLNAWIVKNHGKALLSTKKIDDLQANRAGIIRVLVKRIEQIDLARPIVDVSLDKHSYVSTNKYSDNVDGVDPKAFSNLLLLIIVKLNATETLPSLLRVEAELHDAVLRLEKDPTFPLPQIHGYDDGTIYRNPTPEEEKDTRDSNSIPEAEKQRRQHLDQICQIQVAHRDTLSAIGYLLRQERNPALLATSAEKQLQQALRNKATKSEDFRPFKTLGGIPEGKLLQALRNEAAKSEDLHSFKTLDDIPQNERSYIIFDPIINIPRRIDFSVKIPYTEALRDEIIQAARTHKPN